MVVWVHTSCLLWLGHFTLENATLDFVGCCNLMLQLMEDLQPYLSLMAAAELVELYNLADPLLGVNLGVSKSRGLANMMSGFTQPVTPGSSRVCLKNSYYAELFKVSRQSTKCGFDWICNGLCSINVTPS